jgi:hypothetical protein
VPGEWNDLDYSGPRKSPDDDAPTASIPSREKGSQLQMRKAYARTNRRHRWSGFRPQAGGIAGLIALADPAGLVEKEVVQRPSADRQITSFRLGDHQDAPHDKQRVRN